MMSWIKNLATKSRTPMVVPYCDTERAVRDWNALLKGHRPTQGRCGGRARMGDMPNFLEEISRGEGGGANPENHEGCTAQSGQQFWS